MHIDQSVLMIISDRAVNDPYSVGAELITNCDDSYNRKGTPPGEGDIEIEITLDNSHHLKRFVIKDYAEGMSHIEIESALDFGANTNRFSEDKAVRGLFGMGLKQVIVALGGAFIESVKDKIISHTKVIVDRVKNKVFIDDILLKQSIKYVEEARGGTLIDIDVTHAKMKIPNIKDFCNNLCMHYALRDVLKRRNVLVTAKNMQNVIVDSILLQPVETKGKKVIDETILLSFGDKIELRVYESEELLTSPNDPFGKAGIILKTKGAALDNSLFKYLYEPAGLFFFGEIIWDNLNYLVREKKLPIISEHRKGILWKHEYAKEITEKVEEIMEPYIIKKRKDLSKNTVGKINNRTKNLMNSVLDKLNKFATNYGFDGNPDIADKEEFAVTKLICYPPYKNINEHTYGTISLYAPDTLIQKHGSAVRIDIIGDGITAQDIRTVLIPHKKKQGIYYGSIKILGVYNGATATLRVTLGNEIAEAFIKVAPPTKRSDDSKKTKKNDGFIKGLISDLTDNPPLRASVDTDRNIRIYVKSNALKFTESNLKMISETSWLELVETIGFAFCRELVQKSIDKGSLVVVEGNTHHSTYSHHMKLDSEIMPILKEDIEIFKIC